jgi:diguanylate cyclase (GGDEF)-like protein
LPQGTCLRQNELEFNPFMDMFTLHIEHAVLLGLFTVLTLINCRLHDGAKDAYWFPAYTLCAFLGAVLIALRGVGLSDAIAVVLGTTFFHLAYLCLHRGLDGLYEGNDYPRWPLLVQFGAVLIAIAGLIQFGFIHENTARRVIYYSLVFAFQTALIAVVSFRNARGYLAVPGRLMSGLLALLMLNNLVRAGITLHSGAPKIYVQGGLGLQMSLLETTVLQGGITVAFVWMTAAVLHNKLDTLASTDSLTGLLNRRAVEVAAKLEIALSRKSGRPLTAILIDLDHFKQINDSFGHSFGDRALLEVARCLQGHMRQSDLLARVGGDEFAVMLHNTSQKEALEIAERLRSSLEKMVVVEGGVEARVSASLGVAEVDDSTGDWSHLVMKCDKAVYAVKEIGGNLAVAY